MKDINKEIWMPLATALLASIIILLLNVYSNIRLIVNETLASASITVASIFAGFETINRNTIRTLDSRILKEIKENQPDYYRILLRYISDVLRSSILLIIFCLFLISEPYFLHNLGIIVASIWGGLVTWMLVCFYRIHRIMEILYQDKESRR